MLNLTGELNATNIKKFEINLFFNTFFLVKYLSYSLVLLLDFLRMVCRRRVSRFNDKVA